MWYLKYVLETLVILTMLVNSFGFSFRQSPYIFRKECVILVNVFLCCYPTLKL